jgi:hypothetical protein
VCQRGGYRVGNGINWKGQVFPRMRNFTAGHKMTGVGNALKRHYQLHLLEYEQVCSKGVRCGGGDTEMEKVGRAMGRFGAGEMLEIDRKSECFWEGSEAVETLRLVWRVVEQSLPVWQRSATPHGPTHAFTSTPAPSSLPH